MKTVFLILISIVVALSCSIQKVSNTSKEVNYIPYYLKVYEADSLYIVGNYQKSYEILDSLFQKYEPLNQEIFYEMNTYVYVAFKSGNFKEIRTILVKLISEWGYDYNDLNIEIKNKFKFSKEELIKLKKIYENSVKSSIRSKIIEMNEQDQRYRNIKHSMFLNKNDSFSKLKTIDSLNYNLLLHFIAKKKLDFKEIGYRNRKQNTNIDVLLIHVADIDSSNLLKNSILKLVTEGKLTPLNYALIVDRDSLNQNQKYESFNNSNEITNSEKIDKSRKDIGLYPLKYMDWRMNNIF